MTDIATSTGRPTLNWRNLIAAASTVTIFGLALGLMFPLLSLIMEREGVSAEMIGYCTGLQPVGILLSGFIVPGLVLRFGAKQVCIAAAIAAAVIVLLYPVTPIFWAWFALRFFQGLAISTLFTISEAWVTGYAAGAYRGRIVAVYSSVLALSFGLGPTLIAVTGTETALPFIIGAAVLAAAMLPVFAVRLDEPAHGAKEGEGGALTILTFAPKAPVLLLSVGVFAVFDAAFLGFMPIYALKKGASETEAALTLSVLAVGNFVLQLPIGWLADRYPKRAVMGACGLVTAVFTFMLPWTMGTPLMWVILVIIGASSVGIYTIALAEIGERFSGQDLVAGTASFSTVWGMGALIGAVVAGWVFDWYGPDAFPIAIALIITLFLVAAVFRERTKRRRAV